MIGAYREVDERHPLSAVLADARKAGTTIHAIALAPLAPANVRQLVAETVDRPVEEAASLATLVHERTEGNPFFINQVFRTLRESQLLAPDERTGAWVWDLSRIRRSTIFEDVVGFMRERIRRLPAETQRLVTLAACMGDRFDLRTLSLVDERSPAQTARALWAALREGLIVPLDADYMFAHSVDDAAAMRSRPLPGSRSPTNSYTTASSRRPTRCSRRGRSARHTSGSGG